jgi:hypothetical protein
MARDVRAIALQVWYAETRYSLCYSKKQSRCTIEYWYERSKCI